ncbi:hypothetical protein [Acinetobacter sp.]|uniref:hypothetical protein n=1 Tax=Acinetobacter sp. TaxID=472 RepID=UPI002FD9860E
MNRLILTTTLLLTLTACHKSPVEESHTPPADAADTGVADPEPQDNTGSQVDWPLDEARERKAEAAAIAHDAYDPDSIYTGSDNVAIPPPQLKRRLLPGEALDTEYRPVGFTRTFQVRASTIYDITRLRVMSESNDVVDRIEINGGACQISGFEPYTIRFPVKVIYATTFNLIVRNCRADQIREVDLYTTYGKLPYTLIEE